MLDNPYEKKYVSFIVPHSVTQMCVYVSMCVCVCDRKKGFFFYAHLDYPLPEDRTQRIAFGNRMLPDWPNDTTSEIVNLYGTPCARVCVCVWYTACVCGCVRVGVCVCTTTRICAYVRVCVYWCVRV